MSEADEQPRRHWRRRALRLTDARLLIIFLMLVFVLAYLVHEDAMHGWAQCQRSHINTAKINATNQAFQDFLAKFVAKSPKPDDLRRFIRIYQEAKLVVPDCGPKPVL